MSLLPCFGHTYDGCSHHPLILEDYNILAESSAMTLTGLSLWIRISLVISSNVLLTVIAVWIRILYTTSSIFLKVGFQWIGIPWVIPQTSIVILMTV